MTVISVVDKAVRVDELTRCCGVSFRCNYRVLKKNRSQRGKDENGEVRDRRAKLMQCAGKQDAHIPTHLRWQSLNTI